MSENEQDEEFKIPEVDKKSIKKVKKSSLIKILSLINKANPKKNSKGR